MSRLADTILENKAYNQYGRQAMVDIRKGGQNGVAPDFSTYISNAAYVRRNLIAILIEAPRGFQDLENPDYWVSTLKNLVELAPKSIEGLQQTLSVEHIENPFGGAGEVQQDISNVTRARSAPSFTWTEKYGKAIAAFLNGWVLNLIMDPETKYPRVVNNAEKPTDLLPDYTGMTVLFLEPDPTGTKVITAWLSTNMRPNSNVAEITGNRDVTAALQGQDYSVEFTALTQVGEGVNTFAQELLDNMTLTGANPNLQEAFVREIDADVKAGESGYAEQIAKMASSAIS
jgi:hypothetical protein